MKKKIFSCVSLFLLLLWGMDQLLSYALLQGLNRYYGIGSDAEILIVGASQTMLGVDKVLLEKETGWRVANYTREGVNVFDRLAMLRHYFATCKKKPQIVIYGVDKYLFTPKGLSANSYTLFYPFLDTEAMNHYIRSEAPSRDFYLRKLIKSLRFNDLLVGHAVRGYTGRWDNLKSGQLDFDSLRQAIAAGRSDIRRARLDEASLRLFQTTMDFLQQQQVRVVLLEIPYAGPLNRAYPEETAQVEAIFRHFTAGSDGVEYLTFPEISDHQEYYADRNHLNPVGQKVLTGLLSEFLKKFADGRNQPILSKRKISAPEAI